jgi:hypothetical protein
VTTLAGIDGPANVDIETTVTSVDHVESPITGARGALVQIEIFESHRLSTSQHREIVIATSGNFVDAPEERTLGVATLGGSLLLCARDEPAAKITVRARACAITSAGSRARRPLRRVPPELAELFGQPDGGGELWFREVSLAHGDRVRLRAVVVPSPRVVPTEYRSAATTGFETRDDLGAVLLDRLA